MEMHLSMLNVPVAAAACLSAAITIGGLQGQQIKSHADINSWVSDGTASCSLHEQIEVDKSTIVDINPAYRKAAVELLQNESAVLLSREKYKEFVYGREPADFHLLRLRPYIVRAVSANLTNRSISVHRCRQNLFVFRGSLGGDGPQKDPVVVFLREKPRRVFVSYMTAK
jgi:hypothetical protein